MIQDESFFAPRNCLREPIAAIFHAAHLLDRAVGAHLAGDPVSAARLISAGNMPDVRAWTESLWGSKASNPDQRLYQRYRRIDSAAPRLPPSDRVPVRMPTTADMRDLV